MKRKLAPNFVFSGEHNIFVCISGSKAKKALLTLPSLFEEHNLSLAVSNKVLAQSSEMHVRFDYAGCGDSEGNLDEVTVNIWLQNVLDVGQWLMSIGVEEITLVGIRFGALLQLGNQKVLHEMLPIKRQIVWKPIIGGQALVSQLMRLKHTNQVLAGGKNVNWRERISKGEMVEVGGYPLNEKLIASIEKLEIKTTEPLQSPLYWLDLGVDELSPALEIYKKSWPSAKFHALPCPRFWQTPEIFDVPSLLPIHKEILASDI